MRPWAWGRGTGQEVTQAGVGRGKAGEGTPGRARTRQAGAAGVWRPDGGWIWPRSLEAAGHRGTRRREPRLGKWGSQGAAGQKDMEAAQQAEDSAQQQTWRPACPCVVT